MKRNILIGVMVFLVMAVSGLALLAQNSVDDTGMPNDPRSSDHANACFDGGSLAGTCDEPSDWTCGWYLIRYEYGLISFPSRYCSVSAQATNTPHILPCDVRCELTEEAQPTSTPHTLPCDVLCEAPEETLPTSTPHTLPCDVLCEAPEEAQPTNTPHTLPCDVQCEAPEETQPTSTPRPPTATPQRMSCDVWCEPQD